MLDFFLPCNVGIANMFFLGLKWTLTCARYVLSYNVVIGNIYMFVLEVNRFGIFSEPSMLLCDYVLH